MHKIFYIRNGERYNRIGAAYGLYSTGKITNIHVMGKAIARDIIDIWRNVPAMRNNGDDVIILKELQLRFSGLEKTEDYWFLMMSLSYNFGYMRGRKSMRDGLEKRKSNGSVAICHATKICLKIACILAYITVKWKP